MLIVKTELKEVPGKGIGVIASEPIKQGQLVCVYHPVVDIKVYKKDIPKPIEHFYEKYACDSGEGFFLLNTDNARFINHSEQPNTKSLGLLGDDIALRDIAIGEEITTNYRDIDVSEINFQIH